MRTTLFLFLLAAPVAPMAGQQNGVQRSAAGSYSEDQAARGEVAYQAYCASCHDTNFHTDEQFRFNWFGRSVYDLFKILKTTMPEDNIGGLTDDEYTRVIAYILKLNGFAAGADSLKADSLEMRAILITPVAGDTVKPKGR